MKVFTCTECDGHWPVGFAAVVVAVDQSDAADILAGELNRIGLDQYVSPSTMIEIDQTKSSCSILVDGDY